MQDFLLSTQFLMVEQRSEQEQVIVHRLCGCLPHRQGLKVSSSSLGNFTFNPQTCKKKIDKYLLAHPFLLM